MIYNIIQYICVAIPLQIECYRNVYIFHVNVLKRKWFRLGLDKNPYMSEGQEKNRENTKIKKKQIENKNI